MVITMIPVFSASTVVAEPNTAGTEPKAIWRVAWYILPETDFYTEWDGEEEVHVVDFKCGSETAKF